MRSHPRFCGSASLSGRRSLPRGSLGQQVHHGLDDHGAHTGVDVSLTAKGPGSGWLTGNYENTEVYEAVAIALGVAKKEEWLGDDAARPFCCAAAPTLAGQSNYFGNTVG